MHLDKIVFASVYFAQSGKPKTISADFLSKIWNIDNSTANKVVEQNTRLNRQGANNHLSRQFLTNDWMLWYKRINSQLFTDTLFVAASRVSTRGNNCDQIFVRNKWFFQIYSMRSKGDLLDALHILYKEGGVPLSLILDPVGRETSRKVKKFFHQVGTTLRIL